MNYGEDRHMTLVEIQDGPCKITTYGTLNTYSNILDKVNKHFGWDKDVIYYDRLIKHIDELPYVIMETWDIKDHTHLKNKMSGLSSLMARTGFGNLYSVRELMASASRDVKVKVKVKTRTRKTKPKIIKKHNAPGPEPGMGCNKYYW